MAHQLEEYKKTLSLAQSKIQDQTLTIDKLKKDKLSLKREVESKEIELELLRGKNHMILTAIEQRYGIVDIGYEVL